MFYVFLAGFMIPLKPGITSVVPNRFETGQKISLDVICYNADFGSEKEIPKVLLKIGEDSFLDAIELRKDSYDKLICKFDLPSHLPSEELIEVKNPRSSYS